MSFTPELFAMDGKLLPLAQDDELFVLERPKISFQVKSEACVCASVAHVMTVLVSHDHCIPATSTRAKAGSTAPRSDSCSWPTRGRCSTASSSRALYVVSDRGHLFLSRADDIRLFNILGSAADRHGRREVQPADLRRLQHLGPRHLCRCPVLYVCLSIGHCVK